MRELDSKGNEGCIGIVASRYRFNEGSIKTTSIIIDCLAQELCKIFNQYVCV